jgi:hypothetical protein
MDLLISDMVKDKSKYSRKDILFILNKIGRALGELHSKGKRKSVRWGENQFTRWREFLYTLAGEFAWCFDEIDSKKIERACDKRLNLAKKTAYFTSFHHGDFDLKNIFYDPATERITLFDLSTAHQSVSQEGIPIGYPAFDIALFEGDLSVRLQQSEPLFLKECIQSFRGGYLELIKKLPPTRHLYFTEFLTHLVKFHQTLKHSTNAKSNKNKFKECFKDAFAFNFYQIKKETIRA